MSSNSAWASPLFRWAGSKRKLLPELMAHVPASVTRYIEPFAGSGCLFFALCPPKAVLGDMNRDLIAAYGVIRDHPRLVARAAHRFRKDKRTYYRLRSLVPSSLSPIDRASRFVYLNRHCFNGVYRINRDGCFNVPRGTRTGRLPSEAQFCRCSYALKRADLRAVDYAECLADVRIGDFVYLDPPYASKRRNTYGEYGYECFSERNLPELLRLLRKIDRASATFLLSYSVHSTFADIPATWFSKIVKVRRHVAGFAKDRHVVREMLVSNRAFVGVEAL